MADLGSGAKLGLGHEAEEVLGCGAEVGLDHGAEADLDHGAEVGLDRGAVADSETVEDLDRGVVADNEAVVAMAELAEQEALVERAEQEALAERAEQDDVEVLEGRTTWSSSQQRKERGVGEGNSWYYEEKRERKIMAILVLTEGNLTGLSARGKHNLLLLVNSALSGGSSGRSFPEHCQVMTAKFPL
ncbi:hypothetical protein Q8A67_021531 [Cirrhinus molitorella]|uniref:Uncharacterized protein n=1 Tax=Cirrhinus molitorella TaxID=172907 RepID=A0AA88TMW0_9TELE|nr:hypothetical protein Q8A67_021531 [Cirrhinus molitorella]